MSTSTPHVPVLVVGSGFGGSVTAYRLASAGHEVTVLERGRAWPPGSFPRTPAQVSRSFWDPSAGLHGLFDVWRFRGTDGIVASGLGGGSLVYANVLLRKDERWFTTEAPLPGGGYEHWPVTRADLDPHYDAVEHFLGATPYPYADTTAKTRALRDAAGRLQLPVVLPPLAVSFAARPGAAPEPGAPLDPASYGNLHGLPRRTCRRCGECDLGCNDGAKNTLDHTYLSAAVAAGADLRTGCEVRAVAPRPGGGYEVRYVVHDPDAGPAPTASLPVQRLTCDRLVLAAGTFGTSWLLLRSRGAFPGLSRALGSRFSGNGDLLAFVLGARDGGGAPLPLDGSVGTVITSAVRVGDEADGDGATGRGHYVQDAGYPGFAEWLVEAGGVPAAVRRAGRTALGRLSRRLSRDLGPSLSADLAALLGGGATSSAALPLLGMGRDVPDGTFSLRRGRLDLDWTTATSLDYLAGVRGTMAALAGQLGGRLVDSPLWWSKRVVTVHPLGGAPMGRHVAEGVADSYGEVFGFPGLHVLDGALVPGPVGPNPSLTIAAVADRACDHLLETATAPSQRRAPERLRPQTIDLRDVSPHATAVEFTEKMKGFVALDTPDPLTGQLRGRALDQRLMFRLTITVDDVERFVADPAHPGRAEGWVQCDVLGGRLPVVRGWFNLFVRDDDPRARRMLYRLWLDADGTPLTLAGVKDVRDDDGFDVWRDTSTLSVRVLSGHVPAADDDTATPVAAGVITIHLPDFLQQLTTFRAHGPEPARALAGFSALFLGELAQVYRPRAAEPEPQR